MDNKITSETRRPKREYIEVPSTLDTLSSKFGHFVLTYLGRHLAQLLPPESVRVTCMEQSCAEVCCKFETSSTPKNVAATNRHEFVVGAGRVICKLFSKMACASLTVEES